MKRVLYFIPLAGIFLFISCSDDKFNLNEDSNAESTFEHYASAPVNDETILDAKSDLAEQISCLVEINSTVLTYLNNQCDSSEINGHYDTEMFWNIEKDEPSSLFSGESISDQLVKQDSSITNLLTYLCNNVPALAILMVGDDGISNPSTKIYFDNGFDDQDSTDYIPYFDNCSLDSTMVDSELIVPTFIVRESEFYISLSELKCER